MVIGAKMNSFIPAMAKFDDPEFEVLEGLDPEAPDEDEPEPEDEDEVEFPLEKTCR